MDEREFTPLLYDDLRSLAASYFRRQRSDHTLQPTALVHEVWVRLADKTRGAWRDESHFLAVAARAMRQVLVDHARGRNALKRAGNHDRITLDLALPDETDAGAVDLLDLDDAIAKLAELDDRKAKVLELRLFGGLTIEQAAEALDVSVVTVSRDWRMARAWVANALDPEGEA